MSGEGEGLVAAMPGGFDLEPALAGGTADAIKYLEDQARNFSAIERSPAAAPDDRERARITRQCAERWAQDFRAGMHEGKAGGE